MSGAAGWQRLERGVSGGRESGANFAAFSFFCFPFETNRKKAVKHLCVGTELVQSPIIANIICALYFLRGQAEVQVFAGSAIREDAGFGSRKSIARCKLCAHCVLHRLLRIGCESFLQGSRVRKRQARQRVWPREGVKVVPNGFVVGMKLNGEAFSPHF